MAKDYFGGFEVPARAAEGSRLVAPGRASTGHLRFQLQRAGAAIFIICFVQFVQTGANGFVTRWSVIDAHELGWPPVLIVLPFDEQTAYRYRGTDGAPTWSGHELMREKYKRNEARQSRIHHGALI